MDFSKYRDKTFAQVSKEIQEKYAERYDPISQRGLNSEMTQLRDLQEQTKIQGEEGQLNPNLFTTNNMGASVQPNVSQQEQSSFNRAASQPYNQKFQDGGWKVDRPELPSFDPIGNWNYTPSSMGTPIQYSGQITQSQPQGQSTYGRDPLSYAPALGGVLALINNRRSAPTERRFVDPNLATSVSPRQTQFSNVDMSQIERQIEQQSRGFTGSNINVSGGNAGSFLANELANSSNVMNAIGQARLQGAQMDQRTQAMNAQEQARIDQFNQSQNMQRAEVEARNNMMGLQYDDIDARNTAAYRSNQNDALQSILGNLGSIGRENTQSNVILRALGYDPMGNYGGQGSNAIQEFLNLLRSNRGNA